MSELKIGFIGLGDQGAPMAEAISERGLGGADGVVELVQWIEARKSLAQGGARHR
jgi:3-hydroxyisobutyrate dehydrogenase-like beta-hydroxyacid dehydrogenase